MSEKEKKKEDWTEGPPTAEEMEAPEGVSKTKTSQADEAFAHVVTVLELDDESVKTLIQSKIMTVRRMYSTQMDTYNSLAEDKANTFSLSDADQIYLFKRWYGHWLSKTQDPSLDELMACFTDREWDSHVHRYHVLSNLGSSDKSQDKSSSGTAAQPIVLDSETSGIRVSLKDYPITSGKSADWPKYRRKFISTATAAGHAALLRANYAVPRRDTDEAAYFKYLKLNRKTFSALDYGLSDSTLWNIVERFRDNEDGRGAFLALDLHQRGQGCEETCATNAFDELLNLSLTPHFPGGAEAFVNKWDNAIRKLEDLDGGSKRIRPTEWLEKTLFKGAIKDKEYDSVLTTLNALTPPASLDKCKSEIRKKGAQLLKNRTKTSIARARRTQLFEDDWDYDRQEHQSWDAEPDS